MKCVSCKKDHNQVDLMRVEMGGRSSEWACEEHLAEAEAQQRGEVAKANNSKVLGDAGNAIAA